MKIIDFHAHAFPDELAPRAMAVLDDGSPQDAYLDGTISSLLHSMDGAGIEQSVIASIATQPKHFHSILAWSREIKSDRIIPFLSVHPDDPDAVSHIHQIAREGFCGIKLHPYYQEFILDDERMFSLYQAIAEGGLILLCHTGFDIAYERVRKCDPERIVKVCAQFPELTFVASHLGGWEDWDEVEKHIVGKPICMELSYAVGWLSLNRIKDFLMRHPMEYIFFGTDSPWADQKETIDAIRSLGLAQTREEALLFKNAERLLKL